MNCRASGSCLRSIVALRVVGVDFASETARQRGVDVGLRVDHGPSDAACRSAPACTLYLRKPSGFDARDQLGRAFTSVLKSANISLDLPRDPLPTDLRHRADRADEATAATTDAFDLRAAVDPGPLPRRAREPPCHAGLPRQSANPRRLLIHALRFVRGRGVRRLAPCGSGPSSVADRRATACVCCVCMIAGFASASANKLPVTLVGPAAVARSAMPEARAMPGPVGTSPRACACRHVARPACCYRALPPSRCPHRAVALYCGPGTDPPDPTAGLVA